LLFLILNRIVCLLQLEKLQF